MKNTIIVFVLFYSSLSSFAQQKLFIDASQSTLHWSATDDHHRGKHNGKISFQKGHVIKKDTQITEGMFEVDLYSKLQSYTYDSKTCIPFFSKGSFDIKKHPGAILHILHTAYTGPSSFSSTGYLIINDIRQPITFLSTIKKKELYEVITSNLVIDPMLWSTQKAPHLISALSFPKLIEISLQITVIPDGC